MASSFIAIFFLWIVGIFYFLSVVQVGGEHEYDL